MQVSESTLTHTFMIMFMIIVLVIVFGLNVIIIKLARYLQNEFKRFPLDCSDLSLWKELKLRLLS